MNKGIKTTITAIVGAVLFISLLCCFIFDYINIQEYAIVASSLTAFMTFMIGIFSKDYNKSHTK